MSEARGGKINLSPGLVHRLSAGKIACVIEFRAIKMRHKIFSV